MICKPCSISADHFSNTPLDLDLEDPESMAIFTSMYHKDCTGCDCQHKPPGTGIKKEIKNAQGNAE